MSRDITASPKGCLVNGKWLSRGLVTEIRSPYDGRVVGAVHLAHRDEVELAIDASVRAFEITKKLGSFERKAVLQNIAAIIENRHEEFARSIALEAGKPIRTSRAEVDRAVFTFTVAAEEATRIGGEYLPLDWQEFTAGRWGIEKRFPLGPVAAITPFNFPVNLVAHKIAPAIAAGCTMVLKPAPQTPLTALMLAEAVHEAGWPAGALNVLPMSNEEASLIVSDDRLKMLSFTGSATVGWQLNAKSGKKRVVLELGGNAGVLIHSDANVDYAVERCVTAGFSYSGQSCISVQRILVHRPVYERFLENFVAHVQKLKSGDPLDESTDVGPLIREQDAIRAVDWVERALQAGAKLLTGGSRKGSVVEPTVLTKTTPTMAVNCEEVFAPVKTVEPYDDFDDAIAQINDSRYGLQAGIFTNDARLLFRAYNELEVGGVIAGDVPTFRIDHMPYGGVKDSGRGREGLRYAIQEMTEPKLLVMNLQ
ncbi:MAG TPA: aldehyde dehydrogenase family protein [Terriglobales bacterium]|nr:aldehyde dehydrogenase family protein [Terriglobales bacterium]